MWTDISKLDHDTGRVGVAICWKKKFLDLWKEKSTYWAEIKKSLI